MPFTVPHTGFLNRARDPYTGQTKFVSADEQAYYQQRQLATLQGDYRLADTDLQNQGRLAAQDMEGRQRWDLAQAGFAETAGRDRFQAAVQSDRDVAEFNRRRVIMGDEAAYATIAAEKTNAARFGMAQFEATQREKLARAEIKAQEERDRRMAEIQRQRDYEQFGYSGELSAQEAEQRRQLQEESLGSHETIAGMERLSREGMAEQELRQRKELTELGRTPSERDIWESRQSREAAREGRQFQEERDVWQNEQLDLRAQQAQESQYKLRSMLAGEAQQGLLFKSAIKGIESGTHELSPEQQQEIQTYWSQIDKDRKDPRLTPEMREKARAEKLRSIQDVYIGAHPKILTPQSLQDELMNRVAAHPDYPGSPMTINKKDGTPMVVRGWKDPRNAEAAEERARKAAVDKLATVLLGRTREVVGPDGKIQSTQEYTLDQAYEEAERRHPKKQTVAPRVEGSPAYRHYRRRMADEMRRTPIGPAGQVTPPQSPPSSPAPSVTGLPPDLEPSVMDIDQPGAPPRTPARAAVDVQTAVQVLDELKARYKTRANIPEGLVGVYEAAVKILREEKAKR